MKKKNNIFVGVALLLTGLGVLPIAFCHGQLNDRVSDIASFGNRGQGGPIVVSQDGKDKLMTNNPAYAQTPEQIAQAKAAGAAMSDLITDIDKRTQELGNDTGPNARDYPANESFRQNNSNGYNNNGYNDGTDYSSNNNFNNSHSSQTVRHCSPEAYQVGIKHYQYDEANPRDLVKVGSRKLHRDAAASLKNMKADARRNGITLTVGSAYRSINYQQGIINRKKGRRMSPHDIYSASAPAGHSEHSTGYVVDFTPINSSFGRSDAYDWLVDNARSYGWEQSFTAQTARQDNVMIEPWHWRFVGTTEAAQMFHGRKECP